MVGLIWFYWKFYDHFSAHSLLAKLGRPPYGGVNLTQNMHSFY